MAINDTTEYIYFIYCTAMWQYLEVELSAEESARVTSVLSAAFTIGPLVTAFISLKVKPDWILAYHYGFLTLGISALYFGRLNSIMIYAGSGLLGNVSVYRVGL